VLDVVMRQSTEFILMALIVVLLFYNVVLRGLDLVVILFLLFLTRRAITFALEAQTDYRKFLSASGSIRVFQRLESELEENREEVQANGPAPDFKQPIVLKGVGFRYQRGERVLKNISMKIPPNTIVGIVGESGAGKSTLTNLLTGILTPTEGAIYLGDLNYKDLDQLSLRRGIGYVTQETVIFNETIRNNITLWRDDAHEDKVRAAASKAHLTEFIANLPRGYDTVMGDAGINVSGGERQRISIARELFKDAEFLIFDEATSSLDSKTEREIQERIEELRGEKTVVIIAHRLSTVRNSDLIFVLKDGEIVEQGKYEMLYARGGEFTAMVNRQALTME
jgi:subfamily B ATP-binding cassette protein MsbA